MSPSEILVASFESVVATKSRTRRTNVDDRARTNLLKTFDAIEHLLRNYRPVEIPYDPFQVCHYLSYGPASLFHSYDVHALAFWRQGVSDILECEAGKEAIATGFSALHLGLAPGAR